MGGINFSGGRVRDEALGKIGEMANKYSEFLERTSKDDLLAVLPERYRPQSV